jgi:hypothetical protein
MLLPSVCSPAAPALQLRSVKELMEGKGDRAPVHRRRHGRNVQESAGIQEKATRAKSAGIVNQCAVSKQ